MIYGSKIDDDANDDNGVGLSDTIVIIGNTIVII